MKNHQKETIFEVLRRHPEGLTLQKIAEMTKMSRITATKYVHELIGEGKVYQRQVGVAKLCYPTERFIISVKEDEIIKKIKKKLS
ncbi:MAG: helix-turn-helix domain-containing protein [Candidatus Aenigmatarchaeota archaeon]